MGGVSMEWKEVRLGEVADVQTGPFGSQLHKENYVNKGTPIVTVEHLGNKWFTSQNLPMVSDEDKLRLAKYCSQEGDVIFSRVGSVDRCSYVSKEYSGWLFSGRCLRVRPRSGINPEYLYYFLTNEGTKQYIRNIAVGATMPSINTKLLNEVPITIPSLGDQRRIASILSSLDRKIELNNKINADLEEMAQAIFKNWFVDFEPFKDGKFVDSELGMIPEGWKVISLSEIMKYNGGSQPPASEFIDTYQEGYIRFIQIRDYDNDSHITYIPISKRNKLCDELDIMIARYGAALGRICWGLKGAYNVALAKVTPIKSYYREYLRCYLNTSYFYQSINNKGARCAQSGFNQSDINSYMIAFPIDETVVMNFNDLCSSIMDKRLSLRYENSRLALLRDTLLPRLMSGELEVPE